MTAATKTKARAQRRPRAKTYRLPRRSLDEVMAAQPAYRQSALSQLDNCSLSARFDLEGRPYTTSHQARGIVWHRFAERYLKTLWQTGAAQMPHEEAIAILYEASRQEDVAPADVVVVPMRERLLLRKAVFLLREKPMNMRRLIAVEERLEAPVWYTGPDGYSIARTLTGQPDAIIAKPPDGLVIIDWKLWRASPPEGDQPHWTGDDQHVSTEGYFQQRFYALLAMLGTITTGPLAGTAFPDVKYVTLREYYPLLGESRNATVPREALEHILHEFADLVAFMDRGMQEGSASKMWKPSPGRHCSFCRTPALCPIEWRARAKEGGIDNAWQAKVIAGEDILAKMVHKHSHGALKDYFTIHGVPIPVKDAKGRYEYRMGGKDGRRFGVYPALESDRGPEDPVLNEAFEAAAARKASA